MQGTKSVFVQDVKLRSMDLTVLLEASVEACIAPIKQYHSATDSRREPDPRPYMI